MPGPTRNTGYLQNIVQYDASNNIILPSLIGTGTRIVVAAANGTLSSQTASTTNIAEGTNLYYTDTRVGTYLSTNTYATQSYVTTAIANLVDASPATLDTLNELAAALGDDPNFATTVATSIGTKQAQLNGTGFVKVSGTTVSYDNSTYLTTSSASSTYVPYTGASADLVLGANNFSSKRVSVLKSSDGYSGFTSNYLFLQTGTSTTNVGTDGISLFSKPNQRALSINYDIAGVNYSATLDANLLNASRTFEFPNASGILALTSNIPTLSSLGGQTALSGTGFVKISGTTISYDNSAYLTTASATSTYLPLTGGTLTGALSGTSAIFSGGATFFNGGNTFAFEQNVLNSGNSDGAHIRSVVSVATNPTYSWAGDTDTGMYKDSANTISFSTNGVNRLTIGTTGAATFSSSVTADNSTFATAGGGLSQTTIGKTSGGYAGLRLAVDATFYSWIIGAQYNASNSFEITPSTAVGGSTFTTPVFKILNTGAATFSNSIDVTTSGSFGFQDYRTQATQKVLVLRGEGVSGQYAPSLFNIYTKPGTTVNGVASIIIKSKYSSEAESGNLFEFKGDGSSIFSSSITAGGSGRTLTIGALGYANHINWDSNVDLALNLNNGGTGGVVFFGGTGTAKVTLSAAGAGTFSSNITATAGTFSSAFATLSVIGTNATSPHIGSNWTVNSNQDGVGRTIISTAGQARAMYFENNGSILIPNTSLSVGGKIYSTSIHGANLVAGNIAGNMPSAPAYILIVDLNNIAGFSLSGKVNAASYTCWNISDIYIQKNYSSTAATAGIEGKFKSGCDFSIVNITYGAGNYIALRFTSNPEIDVLWTGFRLTDLLSGGAFQVVTSGVTVNSTYATY